jgi:IstB-like ATP binding protein
MDVSPDELESARGKRSSCKQLRLGGMAAALETRLRRAQAESMASIALILCLVSHELSRRGECLLERRQKQVQFRDLQKTLDNFNFHSNFNKQMNRSLDVDLAGAFISRHAHPCNNERRPT